MAPCVPIINLFGWHCPDETKEEEEKEEGGGSPDLWDKHTEQHKQGRPILIGVAKLIKAEGQEWLKNALEPEPFVYQRYKGG